MKGMTDIVTTYWTVVAVSETDDIGRFITSLRSTSMSDELKEIMKGYMDCIEGRNREICIAE